MGVKDQAVNFKFGLGERVYAPGVSGIVESQWRGRSMPGKPASKRPTIWYEVGLSYDDSGKMLTSDWVAESRLRRDK